MAMAMVQNNMGWENRSDESMKMNESNLQPANLDSPATTPFLP